MTEAVIGGLTADQEYHVAVKATEDQGLVPDLSTWSPPQLSTG